MKKTLKEMPYAQAVVLISEDECCIELKSYNTIVARLYCGSWLTIHGLYSMTTRRHIKAFCKEYCGITDFQLIKTLATQHLELNIHTGEVIELPNLKFGD